MTEKSMTKKEAEAEFRKEYLPIVDIEYGENDKSARREEWGKYTDYLCKTGRITQKQYETWANPY